MDEEDDKLTVVERDVVDEEAIENEGADENAVKGKVIEEVDAVGDEEIVKEEDIDNKTYGKVAVEEEIDDVNAVAIEDCEIIR